MLARMAGVENREPYTLSHDYHVDLPVSVPADDMTWYVIE